MYCQPLTAIATATPPPGESGGGLVEAEKKINLDLEIGRCASGSEKREKRECVFTGAQLQELCNQIYICNSIAYGFPVGFELLLPIWISVFKSLGPAVFNTYPTFSGFGSEKCDHSSVMDSEPGRCRRTDGRKWRCSKNVLPLQKYCQRHMHRGRQGSRKHVEPIERLSGTDNRASDDTRMPVMSLLASDVDSTVSVAIRSDISSGQPRSSYYGNGFPAILKCSNNESRDATLANNSINDDYASSRTNCLISGGDGVDDNPMSLSSRKQNVVGNNYVGFNSPRYGLSPKSVLIAAGKIGLGSGCTTAMEAEQPQRCRRTDGKKWQCRRDALNNQKYCNAHMHRGSKRLLVRPEYSSRFQATPTTITRNLDSGINLNTIPANPHRDGMSNDSSSSTSDATTITDENISVLS